MNPIWHIFKKDALRLRFLLITWIVLILCQSMMGGMQIASTTGNTGWQIILSYVQYLVPFLQWIAMAVMVPLLIHEEPLTGTTAFWFTRPISRRMLLKEKSLFIGLFLVAAPLFVEALVMAANGITLHHILLAVPEIILKQLSVISLVALGAVITPNFAKFVQVAVIAFIAQMLLQYLLMISRLLGQDALQAYLADQALGNSRYVVAGTLTIFFGAFLISHQYLTRATRKTVLYALPCILVVLGVHNFWSLNFLESKEEAVSKTVLNSDAVSLSYDEDSIYSYDKAQWNSKSEPRREIFGGIEVAGGESRDLIEPISVDAALTFPDGKSFTYKTPDGEAFSSFSGSDGGTALQSALGPVEWVNKGNGYNHTTLFEMDGRTYQQYLNTPGAYSAKIKLTLSRFQVEGELPLARGSRFKQGSEYVVITDVLHEPHGVSVMMRTQTVNLLFDRNRPASTGFNPFGKNDVLYVLENKQLGQAFLAKRDSQISMEDMLEKNQRLRTHSFRQQFTSLTEPYEKKQLPDITEDWLKGATLVRLRRVEMGTFTKPLVAGNFWLERKANRPKTQTDKTLENKLREADALVNLANVYSDTARYAQAEPLYNAASTIQVKYIGPESPELAYTLLCHALMYGKEKKTAKALALNERLLAIKVKNSKVTTPEWDALYKDLANLEIQNKDFIKAESYLKSGVEECKSKYGEQDAKTIKMEESLKDYYLKHPKR